MATYDDKNQDLVALGALNVREQIKEEGEREDNPELLKQFDEFLGESLGRTIRG